MFGQPLFLFLVQIFFDFLGCSLCFKYDLDDHVNTKRNRWKRLKIFALVHFVLDFGFGVMLTQTIARSPSNMIYNPATYKLMSYMSIVTLIFALYCQFQVFRKVSYLDYFWPTNFLNEERNWEPSLLSNVYLAPWMMYFTAFLWRPSTQAMWFLFLYPAITAGWFHTRPHLSRVFKMKDLSKKKGV